MNQIRLNSESVSVGAWRLGTKQADRLFGAGHDTQSACLAGVRQRRVGGVPTMSHASELAEQNDEPDPPPSPDIERGLRPAPAVMGATLRRGFDRFPPGGAILFSLVV